MKIKFVLFFLFLFACFVSAISEFSTNLIIVDSTSLNPSIIYPGDVVSIKLESLFIGVIGGILGIFFGSLISFALSFFFALKTAVTLFLILQVFFFAVIVGVFSGIYPAFVAAKMDPVKALRYE